MLRAEGEPLYYTLTSRPADAVLFRTPQRDITTREFLGHAQEIAQGWLRTLGDCRYIVNRCSDRYAFAVVLAAALISERVSILSGDHTEGGLAALTRRYPGAYCLGDEAAEMKASALIDCAINSGTDSGPAIPPDRVVAIVHTSGTTGEPAGHLKRWGALTQRTVAAAYRFGFDQDTTANILATVPPQHMYGFETSVLLPLHANVATWCGPAFYPGDVQRALERMPSPRVLITTPLQMRAQLEAGLALPPLARVISATAPLADALAAAAESAWSTEVNEIFGATEVGSIASRRTLKSELWSLYSEVALRLEGTDRATDLVVTAPFADPCPLNDLIVPEPDGQFRLLGRKADMVKLGGKRASLAGLNTVLNAIDGVVDGIFVAPDDLDQRPTARLLAFVVAPERSAAEILAALRGKIDPIFLPRRVIRVDALPRNQVGKLPHDALATLRAAAGEV
jgi:acyl-coenzyme A synthetase/AMP-(fatty) acid ligase